MASHRGLLASVRKLPSFQRYFSEGRVIYNRPSSHAVEVSDPNVPGLSENVVKVATEPVGPGASKESDYKNPEYFCYNENSYFEAEVEMMQYRLQQPSSKKKA